MATQTQYQAAKQIILQVDAHLDASELHNGTVQAETMVRLSHRGLIPSDPTLHQATEIAEVYALAGCEQDEECNWYARAE